VQFYHDLIAARCNSKGVTAGLEGNECSILEMDNTGKLVAFDRWNSAATNQNVVVVGNFAGTTNSNYNLPFPAAGAWYVHLNSDATNYGADYGNLGSTVVTAAGNPPKANITIGPYSALILSQTPVAAPQLTITATNGAVNLAWPVAYEGWILEASTKLAGSPAWVEISPAQYQTNAASVFYSASPTGTNTFYRLLFP